MSVPAKLVEIAFASKPGDIGQVWTDVTNRVSLTDPMTVTRGRSDEWAKAQAGSFSLVLDNTANGDFTPGRSASTYYPNVKLNKRIRYTLWSTAKNLVPNPGFESGTTGWVADTLDPAGTVTTTLASSTAHAHSGSKSMLATFSASGARAMFEVSGLTTGATYTLSGWVWLDTPSGSAGTVFLAADKNPTVAASAAAAKSSNSTTTTGTWQQKSVTFTAASSTTWIQLAYNTGSTQGVWFDDVQLEAGASVTTFDGTGATVNRRFSGFINDYAPDFEGLTSKVTITASDRFKPLATAGALDSMLTSEILADDPEFYYRLTETAGVSTAVDSSARSAPALTLKKKGSPGTVTFAGGVAPPTETRQPVLFTRPGTGATGSYLGADITDALYAKLTDAPPLCDFTAATWVSIPSANATARQTAVYLDDATGALGFSLGVDTSGHASLVTIGAATVTGPVITDGLAHHLAVVCATAASTMTFYVDGVNVGSSSPSSTPNAVARIAIGGNPVLGEFTTGTVSHVSLTMGQLSATRIGAHYTAGTTGFAGETTGQRIARIASYAGIPARELNLDTGASTVAFATTEGADALTAMRAVEDTEQGLLVVDGAGRITFQSRTRRYNPTAAFTAHANLDQVDAGFTTPENDAFLKNDVTYNRTGGADQRVVNQTSIDDYGTYKDGPTTVLATSDGDTYNTAAWKANVYGQPAPRVPSLAFDVLTLDHAGGSDATLAAAVLALDLGALITVDGLPSQAPAASMQFYVEGLTETSSKDEFRITVNTSPVLARLWVLEDPTSGYIDSTFVVGL